MSKDTNAKLRMQASRKRRVQRGWKQVTLWLHRDDVAHFKTLIDKRNKERGL